MAQKEEPSIDLDDNPALQGGPGLRPSKGTDKTGLIAVVAGVLGLIPDVAVASLPNAGHIGPFGFPVLFAIIAVLFAVIGYFRYMDLGVKELRNMAMFGGALGLVRLFLYPLLAAFA